MSMTTDIRYRLESANDRCAHGDDPFSRCARYVNRSSRFYRNAKVLRVGRLVVLQAGDASMQDERRELNSAGDQLGDKLGSKCAPCRWHFCASGLGREYRLVIVRRP